LADLLETKQGKEKIASQIQDVKEDLHRLEKAIKSRDTSNMSQQSIADLEKRLSGKLLNLVSEYIVDNCYTEAKRDKVYTIQNWLNPPSFAQQFETARDHKEPGTAEWLLSEDVMSQWLQSTKTSSNGTGRKFDERTVWVQGG
jgi:hypothetical protein